MGDVCTNCGAENDAAARFCNQCGSALEATPVTESERRQITVFFSDLSGYTAISEQLDPEDVQAVMNRIFGSATEIVERYGGRIDQLLGDAVMAVFGDPIVHEDDAERAVRAVLELHGAVAELNSEVEPLIGRPIAMHSGINSGLVVTSGPEFDNAVGDAINVAARLEDLSKPGEILLGSETAGLVAGVFDTTDYGEHELKGKSGLVPVTRVLGIASTRVEPSRRQADFVGRHEELGVLLSAVERMRDGESSVVTIRADAGAGKTRLLTEFRSRLPPEVQWLEGRAYAYGENIPYAAVIDLLNRSIGINEDDGPEVVEQKLRAAAADLVENVDWVYAPLARLFGLAVPEGIGLDRETYQTRLLDAVTEMAEALAGRRPTVLTFQDLHWADPSTVRLILTLIERLETPVVVVANYRPEFSLGATGARELDLHELSPRQTGEMLASLLDGREPPPGLTDFIVARTDGNPFFVEEIVNSLVETGSLHATGDGWEIVADLDEIDLPTSIRGVIAARIDRLDEQRRRVLREASVVGREFLYDIVARVTTMTDELDPSLDALEAADLIREKSADPDLEYFFKHALTQDVAYDGLVRAEREQLHARAAAAIETQFAGRLEEVTETLAYHWLHSGVTDQAVSYLMAAGRKAMERFALEESQAHYRQAYRLIEKEPASEAKDRAIVELLLEWAFLAYYQARMYDLQQLLIEHQEAVDRVGDAEQLGMWMAWIGHTQMTADGEFRKGTDTLDRALEIGMAVDNIRVIAYAEAWRVYGLWWLGRYNEAIDAGMRACQLSEQLPGEPYVWFKAKCGVGMTRATKGDLVEALSIADELVTFGEQTGSARAKSMGHLVQLNIANLTSDEEAVVVAARGIAEAGNDPIYEHTAISLLFTMIENGKAEEARRYHDDQYQRYVVDLHVRLMYGYLEMADAMIKILEGRLSDGFAQLEDVVRKAIASGEFTHEHTARTLLAFAYAGVAMADRPSLGALVKRAGFAVRRGRRASRQAHLEFDDILAHLDESGTGGRRFSLEFVYAQLLAHEGDRPAAIHHLQAGIDAIEPIGDTAGLRAARGLVAELTG